MKRNIVTALAVIGVILTLCGCNRATAGKGKENSTNYNTTAPATTLPYSFHTEQAQVFAPETNRTLPSSEPVTQAPVSDITTEPQQPATSQPTQATTVPQSVTETTQKVYEKTGEMEFSDRADNKYIKAIVNKYGVDAKNLAAIYTVPDNNGNIVLQFDGTTDGNGRLIRNKDTLIAIYSIDKNLISKRASEDNDLNEYSYGEMKVMFFSTTTYIMPKFEAQLNG